MSVASTWNSLRRRPSIQTGVALAFVMVVALLLSRELRGINLLDVAASFKGLKLDQFFAAGLATALAYAALGAYDMLAIWEAGLPVSRSQALLTSFVSYAFNFNFGSLVGAVAMRLRLYGRFGASRHQIGRIMLFCIFTGWIGYSLITGSVFLASPPMLPDQFGLKDAAIRPLGILGIGIASTYVGLCRLKRPPLRFNGWMFHFPSPGVAAVQLLVGGLYWVISAWALYLLLPEASDIAFDRVLAIYLIAAVAALIAHIPAGLGVLEGTFVVLLPELPKAAVVASLLAFRGIFYLIPLIGAALIYAVIEIRHRHGPGSANAKLPGQDVGSEAR